MKLSQALTKVHDEHKMLTNDPLVVEFSGSMALHYFMRCIEADIGMGAGELRATQLRAGWPHPMYDGIEFRVKPRDVAKESAKQFWHGYENLADVA